MRAGKLEEKILFSKIRNSDREAFIKAYDLYVDQIYRFVYFKVGNKEEAEDLSSSVFLKTWGYIQNNNLTDYKNLRSLFYKIARNTVIDHYRKVARRESVAIDDIEKSIELVDKKQNIASQAEIDSDLAGIEARLPELKDEYREVIILRFVNELSIDEIAEVLDKSKGNVRVLVHRALNALRELISQ